jgi:hypothetical protein
MRESNPADYELERERSEDPALDSSLGSTSDSLAGDSLRALYLGPASARQARTNSLTRCQRRVIALADISICTGLMLP